MKIFNLGLNITPGKYKYKCQCFDKLAEKFSPQKISPYAVEFISDDIEKAEAIVFDITKKLDLIVIDLDKIEKRLLRVEDEKERIILKKAEKVLEEEKLLCSLRFEEEELNVFKLLQLVTYKPCLPCEKVSDINELIKEVIQISSICLFFTAGKKEVRAWSVKKGSSVLEAAGKIHSDLKRGFIKAEVVNGKDLDSFFNMAEAKSRGFVKVVDRDYIMQENDITEIRFSV